MIPTATSPALESLSIDEGNGEEIEMEQDVKSPRSGQRQLTFSATILEKRKCIYDNPYIPPEEGILHVFGIMRLIAKSIDTGSHITRNLFIPRDIWEMDRSRLVGIEYKLRMLDICSTQFNVLEALPAPNTNENQTIFDHTLHNTTTALSELKTDLTRPFPNLIPESQTFQHEPTKMERDIVNAVGSNNTMGKLTSLAFGLGRMVKKQAVAVVERANSAQFETISKDTLARYAKALATFFDQVQFLGVWLEPSYPALPSTQNLLRHRAIGHTLEASPRREVVAGIAAFMDEVVCELVLRDIQSLTLGHMQRLSHAFGAFSIDANSLPRTRQPTV